MRGNGGVLVADDLANYQARLLPALTVNYAGWRIGTPGGLTGGTTLARILSRFERGNNAYGSAEYLDRLLHAFSDAFAARYAELGDDNAAEAPDAARSGAMAGSIS